MTILTDVDVLRAGRVAFFHLSAGETADATWPETVTLRRDAAGWRVASEVSRGERTALWDLGTLRVVTGRRSLGTAPKRLVRQWLETQREDHPETPGILSCRNRAGR